MRACIYARYSTDKQRETSIDDQVRVCMARVDAEGWSLIATHADDGISGSTFVSSRPGGAVLLADAMAGRFDVLLLEGLDRLSRDLVEQETIVRRLEHHGLRIIGVADGYDSSSASRKLQRGMRGLINEIYLDDLRHKTHRGLAGQVSRGYNAGGLAYGYRSVPDGKGCRLEVDQEQAGWVVWIFQKYVKGWAPRRIAHELNALAVPSPRGSTWAVSGIYGSPAKGTGILNNELYVGRYIWNRSQWIKHPDTGRRLRLERPQHEWVIEERPELRIVSEDLWHEVRAKLQRPQRAGGSQGKGRAPRTLLGGLLQCGECGGPIIAISNRLYGCNVANDRGPAVCRGVRVPRDDAEKRLVGWIRDQARLLTPDAIQELQREVDRLMEEHASTGASDRKEARARLGQIDEEVKRLVDAIATIGVSDALRQRLQAAEAERKGLQHRLAQAEADRPAVVDVVRHYRERVMNLQGALHQDINQAREIVRQLLGEVVLVPKGKEVWARIETGPEQLITVQALSIGMVAGARFELTTFGL